MSGKPVCREVNDTIKQPASWRSTGPTVAVMGGDGRLAGIVSQGDIATHAHNDHLSADLIEHVSQREHAFLAQPA